MAVTWNRQYRPTSTYETDTNDIVSVRFIRDLADSVNNYRYCVGNFKVIFEIFPGSDAFTFGSGSSFSETMFRMFTPVYRPAFYDSFVVQVCHKRLSGSGTVTWKLYALPKEYSGTTGTFSLTNYPVKPSCSFSSDSSSYTFGNYELTDVNFGHMYKPIFFVLTASGTSTAIGQIMSIDITPMISTRLS